MAAESSKLAIGAQLVSLREVRCYTIGMHLRRLDASGAEVYRERSLFFDTVLTQTAQLAFTSGVRQAIEISDVLEKTALLRVAGPDDAVVYLHREGIDPQDAIFVFPVLGIDVWLMSTDAPARIYAEPSRYAKHFGAYYPTSRSIYVPAGWELNSTWLSLLMLHEGMHALDHRRKGTKGFGNLALNEERARGLESVVIRAVYGGRVVPIVSAVRARAQRSGNTTYEGLYAACESLEDAAVRLVFDFLDSEADYAFARDLIARLASQFQ